MDGWMDNLRPVLGGSGVRDMVRVRLRVKVLGIGFWLGLALGPVSTVIFTPILMIRKR